jgi:hypothetical protein
LCRSERTGSVLNLKGKTGFIWIRNNSESLQNKTAELQHPLNSPAQTRADLNDSESAPNAPAQMVAQRQTYSVPVFPAVATFRKSSF